MDETPKFIRYLELCLSNQHPDLVHNMAVGNLNGEFCTAITVKDAIHLCDQDADYLDRVQGNE